MRARKEVPTVVIGAGLSGLAAALSLSRRGIPVMVVEAQQIAGGCCSTEVSDGYTFNNGAVYVAVPSLLHAAFGRLGLSFDEEVELVGIARPHATYLDNGTAVHLSTAEHSYVDGADHHRRTQALRDGLAKLRDDWRPIYATLVRDVLPEEPSLLRTIGKLWRHLPRMGGHVNGLIASYFPDRDLQAAVASTLLYTGLAPDRLPATQIIGLLALLEEGFHLPRGGMGAISAALLRALQGQSVSVRFGTKVREIVVSDGRVHGVVLTDGEHIPASHVVATCSGLGVVKNLLRAADIPRSLAAKADKAPLSHRAISIQIGYSGAAAADAFIVNHVPAMEKQGAMHVPRSDVPPWIAYTQPTRVLPELAPGGRHIIELYAPASDIRSVSEWNPAWSDSALERYLDALQKRVPGMAIERTRVLDPQDFARERQLDEGALYGIAPGSPPHRFLPHRTPISGLYLGGQTTFPGYGVPSAMLSGIQSAESLVADLSRSS
ncbi:putative amine oxydase, deshydrogenase; Phytoene dehydrogenase [Cupriavidus taiwanensis]|uniref:phytoene desaturase family protein n=1 Tax=Cupriavidus taiwanensis TaxID=164546 RepID=UPI000E138312|nr:NAD(P)/FAD-dependent oxidoreductase [Cupriavidus taiwanensis]SOY92620.1 putative amine oxydase, deshydrogenase; Phytoene dehydrogenase [Cupriavidus taiwanensis]SOY98245.1 putative amine oxydase, deshydrogenase; Phytoene dehydrogenase [Cupriavidus taiwanensis]